MCKAMEDMRNQAEILSAIKTAHYYHIPENQILLDIMDRFGFYPAYHMNKTSWITEWCLEQGEK